MADLILEPYSVNQRWRFKSPDVPREDFIAEYMEAIAHSCEESGKCVVGHIKALALFPDGGLFQVSVVSPHLPAAKNGRVPAGCPDLTLSLNVIVYGLERPSLERIVWDAADQMAKRHTGEVAIEALEKAARVE